MPKNKRRQQKKKSSTGDVARAPKRTYTTASCKLPKLTDYCVIRSVVNSTFTCSAGSATNPTYYFSISQTYTGATSVFDQYMIEAIRFSISPQQNAVGQLGAGLTDVYCVIDYDDATALTLATSQSSANVIKLAPGESLQRVFQPRVATAAYSGSFSGFANVGNLWIDSASTTVQHYGIKLYIPATGKVGQTDFQIWDVQAEYFVKYRKAF